MNQKKLNQGLPNRSCVACKKKPPQVQCLHCSQYVCLACAHKHADMVALESDGALHLLNEKLDVLDRIAANTRQQIVAVRDGLVRKVDAELDESLASLTQMIEKEKQNLRNKGKELNELPPNEIPAFVQKLKSDVQTLSDKNDKLFIVTATSPRIQLRRYNEKVYDDDDDLYN